MIRLRNLPLAATVAALVLTLAGADLDAQQRRGPGPRGQGQDRAQLEQRVRARFALMIRQRLSLTEEQAERLDSAMESFTDRRQRLFQEEQSLRSRRDAILLDPEPSREEAGELLRRMGELRSEEARLFQEEQEALLEILDPVQLVRLHAMREQLGQRVQQLRRGGGPPGPPGGGGRGPFEGGPPW